jgi:hypothetical protein
LSVRLSGKGKRKPHRSANAKSRTTIGFADGSAGNLLQAMEMPTRFIADHLTGVTGARGEMGISK